MSAPLQHITIVGGGTAGWFAAAMLLGGRNRRNDGPDLRITLIESPTIPTVGVGEATTISMAEALQLLTLDERDFFRQCDATIKAAVRFNDWDTAPDGSSTGYYHPFESPPYLYGYSPAYHYHRRARQGMAQPSFDHAMAPSVAMLDANMAPRGADGGDFKGLSSYSYHLDATRFAAYLTQFCTIMGVEHIRDDVVDVVRADNGDIASLTLAERGAFPVEFVIDCSGFQGLLIRKTLDEPFVTYGDHLLVDSAAALQVPHLPDQPLLPYTKSTAQDAGWVWDVPLYSRRGTGYVFSSKFVSDDEACATLLDYAGPAGTGLEPRIIRMNIGRSRRSWVGNCLALGLASGFIEPLESTSIHFVQMSIRWFLDNFPDRDVPAPLRDRYNARVAGLYEEIRDFIMMHYVTSNRTDAPFWNAAREDVTVPEELAENLAVWRHKLPSAVDCPSRLSLFSEWSYLYVLYGKGYWRDVDLPIDSAISDDDYAEFVAEMDRVRGARMAAAMDHRTLIERLRQSAETPWYRPEGAGDIVAEGMTIA